MTGLWDALGLGPHGWFIIAAYAVTTLTILVLAVWIGLDRRAVKQRLKQLESEGIRRRSDGGMAR